MPGIIIKEQEDLSLGQLSVIENVVLVPLFVKEYLKDDNKKDKDVKVRKYTLYSRFKSEVRDIIPLRFEGDYENAPTGYNFRIGVGKSAKYYTVDESYFYITELLGMGLHVVVRFIGPDEYGEGLFDVPSEASEEESINSIIDNKLSELITGGSSENPYGIYEEFKDRNLYNLKFITSGAHANLFIDQEVYPHGLAEKSYFNTLVNVAARRGDALALIEIENDYDLEKGSFIDRENLESIFTVDDHRYEFAACFYPWGIYSMNFNEAYVANMKNHEMPGGFGYLMAFAYSIQVNEDWFAASGVSRGFIPNLVSLNYEVGDSFMHVLQSDEAKWFDRDDVLAEADIYEEGLYLPIRINPIMFKGAYGNRVWGNRTFSFLGEDGIWAGSRSNISFREYLNVRMLLCDIKKQIYGAATRVTFEPNDDITWLNFKGLVNNLLDRMQNGRGLEWYHWYKEFPDDGHGNRRKATIQATLSIKPIEAVEYFDITVYLTDEEAVVAEPVI